MNGDLAKLEARVTVLESIVAQLQLEGQRRGRRRPEDDVFDDDELGIDEEYDEED